MKSDQIKELNLYMFVAVNIIAIGLATLFSGLIIFGQNVSFFPP